MSRRRVQARRPQGGRPPNPDNDAIRDLVADAVRAKRAVVNEQQRLPQGLAPVGPHEDPTFESFMEEHRGSLESEIPALRQYYRNDSTYSNALKPKTVRNKYPELCRPVASSTPTPNMSTPTRPSNPHSDHAEGPPSARSRTSERPAFNPSPGGFSHGQMPRGGRHPRTAPPARAAPLNNPDLRGSQANLYGVFGAQPQPQPQAPNPFAGIDLTGGAPAPAAAAAAAAAAQGAGSATFGTTAPPAPAAAPAGYGAAFSAAQAAAAAAAPASTTAPQGGGFAGAGGTAFNTMAPPAPAGYGAAYTGAAPPQQEQAAAAAAAAAAAFSGASIPAAAAVPGYAHHYPAQEARNVPTHVDAGMDAFNEAFSRISTDSTLLTARTTMDIPENLMWSPKCGFGMMDALFPSNAERAHVHVYDLPGSKHLITQALALTGDERLDQMRALTQHEDGLKMIEAAEAAEIARAKSVLDPLNDQIRATEQEISSIDLSRAQTEQKIRAYYDRRIQALEAERDVKLQTTQEDDNSRKDAYVETKQVLESHKQSIIEKTDETLIVPRAFKKIFDHGLKMEELALKIKPTDTGGRAKLEAMHGKHLALTGAWKKAKDNRGNHVDILTEESSRCVATIGSPPAHRDRVPLR
ncbi:hypothetical protein ACHAXT_010936 [Thalassiosira profunda]